LIAQKGADGSNGNDGATGNDGAQGPAGTLSAIGDSIGGGVTPDAPLIADADGKLNQVIPVVDGTYNFYNDGTSGNVVSMVVQSGIITSITLA
jgi:hypothetical protein